MENIIKHFKKYSASINDVWKNRFTWKGMTGKDPKHTTSIRKWEEATKAFEKIERVYTVSELWTLVDKLSNDYVSWVKSIKKDYSAKEYNDMKYFFIGAVGEYFVVRLLSDVKCLLTVDEENKRLERFDFSYVSPTLSGQESDCGIDVYCVVNDVPSVMQVKFWSRYKNVKPTPDVYQKLFCEGVDHDYISPIEEKNIFFFWLDKESTAKMSIIGNEKHREKHLVIIGKKCLEKSIDGRNKIFWDNFYDSLK